MTKPELLALVEALPDDAEIGYQTDVGLICMRLKLAPVTITKKAIGSYRSPSRRGKITVFAIVREDRKVLY